MKQKLFTLLTLALFFCSGAWADDVLLKSVDFTNTTNFPAVTYNSSSADVTATVNGVYFWAKKSKNIKVNNTTAGVDFDSQNIASSGQHGIAIPVTGVNGSITVKVIHNQNTTSANYKVGIAHATDNDPSKSQTWDLSITNSGTKNKNDFQISKTGLEETDYIVWVGESSSSYKVIEGVEIYTAASSGKSKPNLSVTPTSVTLAKDATQQLTPSQDGDGAISYTTSNSSVATVSSSGLITAQGYGSATITVTSAETEDYDAGTTTVGVTVKETDPTILQYAQFDNGLTCSPDGFVTISGSINYNSNYPGTYGGNTYSKGLKMQGDTQINFTTTSVSCDLVIVQSTNTNVNNFKIDDVAFATDYDTKYYYDIPANKVRVHVYKGLTAGNHTIIRATSSELGILYVGVTEAPAPSLSVSPSTASAFSYVEGNGPSAAQTFTVTGENLTDDDITVSLNAGSTYYEISDDGSTYGTSNLTVASGDAVYVRLKAGISLGADYAGTLRFANDGADNVDIALSGSVTNQTYTVTYELNGASGDAPTETAKEEDEVFALAAAPTRDCYTFDGWLCNVDGVTYAAGYDYTMTDAATTFTAQWTKAYASTLDFAAITTAGTTASNPIHTFSQAGGIFLSNLGASSAWETSTAKSGFIGYKLKNSGATVKFRVAAGKAVKITLGNVGANVTLKKDEASSTIDANAGDNAETVVPAFIAVDEMIVSLTTSSASTVTLKKIEIYDVEAISTASGKNYATYVTTNALDFAAVSDEIKAYVAADEAAGTSITFTGKDEVPASTPLLIKTASAGATVYVPVIASADPVGTNKLVAGDGSAISYNAVAGDYFYILSSGTFRPANKSVVATGKAYLSLSAAAGANELTINFDDEAGDVTGIATVSSKKQNNGEYYNLNGQRVDASHKGIVIVNGKKFFNK